MAAPDFSAGEFEKWLNERLDGLGADREVYGVYILGVLQEEETDEEKTDALNGILAAFVDEDTLEEVCQQILKQWKDCCSRTAASGLQPEDELQAIASLIEKQAQIVVKQKEVSEEAKKRKEALLAQYANITDEEDEGEDGDGEETAGAVGIPGDKSLFKNTNVEEVMNRRRQQREQAKDDAQKKKEQDKMQREKDKLAKQERKEKEKKRTQKGERKR